MRDELVSRLMHLPLCGLPDFIRAIAIGGSFARGEADRLSDLDVFLLVDGQGVGEIERAAPEIVAWIGKDALWRGPVQLPHFGYSVTLIYRDLSTVQLHINTELTIETNPMRATSKIIYDRDGFLSRIVAESKGMSADIPNAVADSFRFFWIRMHFAVVALRRGSLWRALQYIPDIRNCMFRLERIRLGKFLPGVATDPPYSRYEHDLGSDMAQDLAFTMVPYSRSSAVDLLTKLVNWMDQRDDMFRDVTAIREVDRDVANLLRREIACLSAIEGTLG